MTTRRPAGAERVAGELRPRRRRCLVEVVGHEDALARGEPVGLDDDRAAERLEEVEGRGELVERAVASGRHARGVEQRLHVGLRALQARALRSWPDDEATRVAQDVREAVDERLLGTDDVQVRGDVERRAVGDLDPLGAHRVAPGGDDHVRGARQRVGERVLSAPPEPMTQARRVTAPRRLARGRDRRRRRGSARRCARPGTRRSAARHGGSPRRRCSPVRSSRHPSSSS